MSKSTATLEDLKRRECAGYQNALSDAGAPLPRYDAEKLKKFYRDGKGNTGDNLGTYECTALFGDFVVNGKTISRGEKFNANRRDARYLATLGLITECVSDKLIEIIEADIPGAIAGREAAQRTSMQLSHTPITAELLGEAIASAGGRKSKKE